MSEPFLALPSARYKDTFIAAMRELEAQGRYHDWNFDVLEEEFGEYVQVQIERETDPLPGFVPETIYWLIHNGEFIGRLGLRHHLNDSLKLFGGHIGYEIRPSRQRMGYGTLICRLGIEKARGRGLKRVLITCDDDNIGSYKIIEANGGILQDKVDNGRNVLTRRYWVDI